MLITKIITLADFGGCGKQGRAVRLERLVHLRFSRLALNLWAGRVWSLNPAYEVIEKSLKTASIVLGRGACWPTTKRNRRG